MDYIKLAQRTIAMLSSMIESGECHTTRSREMKDNALNGLEQLRIHDVVGQSEQLLDWEKWKVERGKYPEYRTKEQMIDDYLSQ